MLIGINRIFIKNENQEFRLDLGLDLKDDLTDENQKQLLARLTAIDLANVKRQDVDLFSFEEDLAVYVAAILIESLDANMFKITLNDTSEYYFEEDSSFLQKREGERMAYIPLNLGEWNLDD